MNSNPENDAHKIALEWLKQIITLSSGIIILSATFLSSVFKQWNWSLIILIVAWILFILSIIFSLNTISLIVTSRINQNNEWLKNKAKAAKILFIVGITLFVLFALINFYIGINLSQQN